MITRDEMPVDNSELRYVNVTFLYLEPNAAESCPEPLDSIIKYLRMESSDGDDVEAEQLHFLRTAQVADARYWIWRFQENDGTECYVTVSASADGTICTGYDENFYSLSPEQFMLGDFYNVF
jgi:hypothetical protein